jgi:hypothetical protein
VPRRRSEHRWLTGRRGGSGDVRSVELRAISNSELSETSIGRKEASDKSVSISDDRSSRAKGGRRRPILRDIRRRINDRR